MLVHGYALNGHSREKREAALRPPGTGEVTRYLAVHGPARSRRLVLVAPLLLFLLKTNDNPDGIDRSAFDGITARIAADRPAAMKAFLDRSYNIDLLGCCDSAGSGLRACPSRCLISGDLPDRQARRVRSPGCG